MHISIVSVFKELYEPFLQTSLIKRACKEGLVSIGVETLFSYVAPKERIDAPSFGHGAGMLIRPEVVQRAVEGQEALHGKAYKIFFSPQGKKLDQELLKKMAQKIFEQRHLMVLPARYEGMDARVEQEYADEIISIGDYVLMGGDIPAMVFLEGLLRLLPGVVGKQESVERESFSGPFVDYPEYTAPVEWKGHEVPAVVRSGDHKAVDAWRYQQAVHTSVRGHFEWVRSYSLSTKDRDAVYAQIPHHYVALDHSSIVVDTDRVGTTSVTTIDIHDIARSAKTYGLHGYYIVTPLIDQQKIVRRLLDFWHNGPGIAYNAQRAKAVKQVSVVASLQETIAHIQEQEGLRPLVIATSARNVEGVETISYYDQGKVWSQERPVLLLFGTGRGLSEEILRSCDYLLMPIKGFTDFNHLSVRSAAAVIFDRWLGLQTRRLER